MADAALESNARVSAARDMRVPARLSLVRECPRGLAKRNVRPFQREVARDAGHELLGTTGLSGVSCHNFNGKETQGFKGIDLITWNDEGRIVRFEVMVRPLNGLALLLEKMTERLRDAGLIAA